MYEYRRGGSVFGAFLLGGLVGATLGLLFAPKSGRETREDIAAKAEEFWGEGIEIYQTGREKVSESGDQLRAKIDDARERLTEQVAKSSETAKAKIADVVPVAQSAVEKAAEKTKGGLESVGAKAQETLDVAAKKARAGSVPGDMEGDIIPEI